MKTKMQSCWLFVVAAAVALTLQVAPAGALNLVNNGGFEGGTLAGWTQTGNTSFAGVQCPGPGFTVAELNCSAFFGPIGSLGGIMQVVGGLIVGQRYAFTFAWEPDGGTPSEFSASLGGVTLLDVVNPAASGFRTFTLLLNATTTSTTVAFNFRDDPGFMFLDAVSLSVPEPASMGLLAIGLAALFMGLRRKV